MKKPNKPTVRHRLKPFLLAALLGTVGSHALDAATNILNGPDQDLPGNSAAASNTNPLTMPEGLTGPKRSIFLSETLLGDFDGYREEIKERGVTITPNFIAEIMGNPTGGYQPRNYLRQRVERAARSGPRPDHPRPDARSRPAHQRPVDHGPRIIHATRRRFFQRQQHCRLQHPAGSRELWLQQSFWLKRASLRIGVLAADAEFFTSSNSSLFINGTFGAFTFVGANLPDPPVYPVAVPGVRLAVQPVSFFSMQVGIYGGDSGGSQDQNNHGTDFNLRSRDGALIFGEAAYLLNQSPGDRGLQGTYKLGSFVHTGSADFLTFDSQTRDALGTGPLKSRGNQFRCVRCRGSGHHEIGRPHGQWLCACRWRAIRRELRGFLPRWRL